MTDGPHIAVQGETEPGQQITDDCPRCPHPWPPHSLIAPDGNPMNGGVALCPVPGCECYGTWSPKHPDLPDPPIWQLTDEEIAYLRAHIQGR